MPVIHDPMRVAGRRGTIYPKALTDGLDGRVKRALTSALGLSQFGVNLTTLEPGAMSAHRHWHEQEDEFVYILQGTPTLVDMHGRHVLGPSMAVGFPAGDKNGHHLVNETKSDVTYLEIGTRSMNEVAHYPDVDMKGIKEAGRFRFTNKAGEPIE